MALANLGFKDPIWSHFGDQNREKEEDERKREEEKEEEEEKPRSSKPRSRGMKLGFWYGTTWVLKL